MRCLSLSKRYDSSPVVDDEYINVKKRSAEFERQEIRHMTVGAGESGWRDNSVPALLGRREISQKASTNIEFMTCDSIFAPTTFAG